MRRAIVFIFSLFIICNLHSQNQVVMYFNEGDPVREQLTAAEKTTYDAAADDDRMEISAASASNIETNVASIVTRGVLSANRVKQNVASSGQTINYAQTAFPDNVYPLVLIVDVAQKNTSLITTMKLKKSASETSGYTDMFTLPTIDITPQVATYKYYLIVRPTSNVDTEYFAVYYPTQALKVIDPTGNYNFVNGDSSSPAQNWNDNINFKIVGTTVKQW